MSEPKCYEVVVSAEARDFLRALDKSTRVRISKRINDLATDPRPSGHKRLAGQEDIYRIRAGNYRVLYVIRDDVLKVVVIKVDHRKDVYRP